MSAIRFCIFSINLSNDLPNSPNSSWVVMFTRRVKSPLPSEISVTLSCKRCIGDRIWFTRIQPNNSNTSKAIMINTLNEDIAHACPSKISTACCSTLLSASSSNSAMKSSNASDVTVYSW
ncbi:Uncharacterised protein [Vibrio cholerae]|uniref:Uncharacterized protein n=1 Tax=Vibrio cholerae TaxID=666 RepID=A0A655PMQ2_VIBCL|nr:Uncharacterised protein [Vibrio cholerae]CSC74222.1 Uncharacterised protein [Vibrio cholerae]